MKHHIIAKFNESVTDKKSLVSEIEAMYSAADDYPFIKSCSVIPNCVARPNRYDVMIVLTLAEADLPLWDASDLHKTWKSRYGDLLEKKCIFDCEE